MFVCLTCLSGYRDTFCNSKHFANTFTKSKVYQLSIFCCLVFYMLLSKYKFSAASHTTGNIDIIGWNYFNVYFVSLLNFYQDNGFVNELNSAVGPLCFFIKWFLISWNQIHEFLPTYLGKSIISSLNILCQVIFVVKNKKLRLICWWAVTVTAGPKVRGSCVSELT